jgi:hypothetical protein
MKSSLTIDCALRAVSKAWDGALSEAVDPVMVTFS